MNKINIKEIINYEIVKKGKSTLQKKAFKALIAFLLLMVLCTLLSRFADSLTIPVVTIESAKKLVESNKIIISDNTLLDQYKDENNFYNKIKERYYDNKLQ